MRWYLLGRAIVPICVLLGAGCASGANSSSGAPAAQAAVSASPQAGLATGPSQTVAVPGAQASPVPAASVQVSPPNVAVGSVSLSLAFEPPRHMEDEARVTVTDPTQLAAPQPTLVSGAPSLGAIVLSDMLHVTNNLDPTQPVPADSPQLAVRHAVVEVLTSDTHQLVPYLGVTMDLLLDGHPVTYGQTLVPMLSQDGSAERVYYGNNIRLPARGTFQVFVRLQRTPLLGQEDPPAAQFNLAVN